jgi:hypothetical protein
VQLETAMFFPISDQGIKPITPEQDMAGKKTIARKSNRVHVHGNVFKIRHRWVRICDWLGASRGPNVMAKAFIESRHFLGASVTRKSYAAQQIAKQLGRELTPEEYKKAVWNSNAVQNRNTREDNVRFNNEHYSRKAGCSARNKHAYRSSRVAHWCHGFCEMFAAPTGMTSNVTRDLVMKRPDESSTQNKACMFFSLAGIAIATTELLSVAQTVVKDSLEILGRKLGGFLIAFPIISGLLGLIGSGAGITSQLIVKKEDLGDQQIQKIQDHMNSTLFKLVHRLKSVKNNAELVRIMGKAMQGKRFMLKKIKPDGLDANGTPKILTKVLSRIDLNASNEENMAAIFEAAGEYMQVPNKPDSETGSRWSRFVYSKKVKAKEREWVSLMGLVEHPELFKASSDLQDARKKFEEKVIPATHTLILKGLTFASKGVDKVCGTHIAKAFEKWTSEEHAEKLKAQQNNPFFKSKFAYTSGSYIIKNRHQYGPITRCFITLAEGMRMVNMNVVLASNANLSRFFNNIAYVLSEWLLTTPASRTLCNSIGRTLGGATLALIFALIPTKSFDIGGDGTNASVSVKNIGFLMFVLATPTLLCQGLVLLAARLEGWKGDIHQTVGKGDKALTW